MPLLTAEVLFTKNIIRMLRFYSLHSCPTPHNTCTYLNPEKHKLDINSCTLRFNQHYVTGTTTVLRSQFKTESNNYKLLFSL